MSEYVITAIAIGWPILVIFCAWSIWWCGRTARQHAALIEACRTPGRLEPAVTDPVQTIRAWNEAIEAAASMLIDDFYGQVSTDAQRDAIRKLLRSPGQEMRSAGMEGTSEKLTAFESLRSCP